MAVSFYDDAYDEGIDEGIDIGYNNTLDDVTLNLIKDGQSNEFISEVTGLSFDEIDELRKL